MKRIVSFFMILAIVFLSVSAAAAQNQNTEIKLAQNPEKGEISVTGYAIGRCIVMILHDGDIPENLEEGKIPVFIAEFLADGKFEYSVLMPQDVDSGKYVVYLSARSGKSSESFIYINAENANKIIDELSALRRAKKSEEFSELILSKAVDLGIDTESELFKIHGQDITDMLFATDFSDINDFNLLYGKYGALCAINASESNQTQETILKYADKLSLNFENDIEGDKRLSDASKEDLYGFLREYDYKQSVIKNGGIDFNKLFTGGKALSAARCAGSWEELKNVITFDFPEVFSNIAEGTKYGALNDKNEVFKKLYKTNFNSVEVIFNEFADICKKVYSSENKTSSSSSSAGNGGSGGGQYTVPEAKPADTVDEEMSKDFFKDVKKDHWSYNALEALYDKKIIAGFEDGEFKGEKNVTRAEFAKMAVAFLKSEVNGEKTYFSYVKDGDWFEEYVQRGAEAGVIAGDGENFRPYENVKREDAALIVYRVMGKNGNAPRGAKFFSDRSSISEYARVSVFALASSGIVNGNGDGTFRPSDSITRFEAVQLLYNAFLQEVK